MSVQQMKQSRRRGGVAAAVACALLGSALASERAAAIDLVLSPSTGTIKVGDAVDVGVLLTGLTAQTQVVSAFDLDLLFNPQIFSLSSVQFSALLGTTGTQSLTGLNTSTPGRIDFSNVSLLSTAQLDALQGDSVQIATLRFVALADGQGTLSFDPQTAPGLLVIGTDPQGRLTLVNVGGAVFNVMSRAQLSQLAPFLAPNDAAMAVGLDSVCNRLVAKQGPLTSDQSDLLARCDRIQIANSVANQVAAIDELNGEDFAAARVQMLLFSNFLQMGIEDRLMALRGGARGLSLAGLNFIIDGKPVPVVALAEMVRSVIGGASADEPGGLLDDKWSLWFRGNYTSGDKSSSLATPGFDASQFAVLGGLDYRINNNFVVGGALSYGNSSIDFAPAGEGTLDTTTISLSLYGSAYLVKNLYADAFVNGANAAYDADRNIVYNDGAGLVNSTAKGDTDGFNLSAGLNLGYEFVLGNVTISPALGAFYIDATVDSFVEAGAGGLDLAFDDQNFNSLTVNAGVRANAILNFSWGVLVPQLRADYVNELENDVAVFGVRFAADPDLAAPPIVIQTDNPDTSYWKLGAGFSAQFKRGISGYVEYQRYEGFDFVQFHDLSAGLRFQGSF